MSVIVHTHTHTHISPDLSSRVAGVSCWTVGSSGGDADADRWDETLLALINHVRLNVNYLIIALAMQLATTTTYCRQSKRPDHQMIVCVCVSLSLFLLRKMRKIYNSDV